MSHLIKLKLQIKDQDLFAQVARDLGLTVEHQTSVKIYNRRVSGLAVRLPGWTYPVVVDEAGEVYFDNYYGCWGDIAELNRLTQEYVAAVVKQEARQNGQYVIYREQQEDGTLVLRVGGGW